MAQDGSIPITDSTMLAKAVELNNLGAACFEARQFLRAMVLFRDALQCVNSPPVDEVSPTKVPLKIALTSNPCAPILNGQMERSKRTNLVTDLSSSLEAVQSFDKAIEIVSTPADVYSKDPLINQDILSAIIAWNLALAVDHLNSSSNYMISYSARLHKAYSLSLHSWSLVQHVVDQGSQGNLAVDFFGQALLDNLAECCQQLDDYAQARDWSSRLIDYAQSIIPASRDNEDPVIAAMLQEQTTQLVLNAIVRLQWRTSHLAPAA
jgi:tetratricopeptide (TPR) repeat protein